MLKLTNIINVSLHNKWLFIYSLDVTPHHPWKPLYSVLKTFQSIYFLLPFIAIMCFFQDMGLCQRLMLVNGIDLRAINGV